MRKVKKFMALGAAAVMAASMLAGCGGSGSAATEAQKENAAPVSAEAEKEKEPAGEAASTEVEKIDLVFSHINAETHTWHKMAEKFKELIEEKSGGNITVTIYPNNQLGSEIETVQSAIAGMGDCDIVLTGESMQTYVEELGIIGMPYAITSDEHMDAVLEGDVGKELEDLMLKAGLRSLGAVKRGPRNITSNKEIHTPDDLKGFIIRTPESKMTMAAFEAMGAKPTPMAFSEIFTSLQQGVIHGQENPLANIYDASLYEVQDYVYDTNHIISSLELFAGEEFWNSLSEEDQKAFEEASQAASDYAWDLYEEQLSDDKQFMKDNGLVVTELSDEDREVMKEKIQPVYDYLNAQYDWVDDVRKMVDDIKVE